MFSHMFTMTDHKKPMVSDFLRHVKTERSGKGFLKRTMQMEVPGNGLLTGTVKAKPLAHSFARSPCRFRRVQFKPGGS